MTKHNRSAHIRRRIEFIAEKHKPRADSSFRGVTGNLLSVAGLFEQIHETPTSNSDYLRTTWLLEDYLHALETNDRFRELEMTELRGYFPDSFNPNHPNPHHEYVEKALQRLT